MRIDRRSIITVLIAIAFVTTYAITQAAGRAPSLDVVPDLESLPMEIEEWQGFHAPELSPEDAAILGADVYVRRYYQSDMGALEIDVAYYTQRRVGASMHSPLNCLPGTGWSVLEDRTQVLDTVSGPREVRELVVRRNTAVFAMTYWYQSRGRVLTGEASTRLKLLGQALRGHPADVGLVRVMTPLTVEAGAGREGVVAFSTLVIPALEQAWQN
jgi:EpsI family protein